MNTAEQLLWLTQNVCSLHIDINDHRGCYQSVEQFVAGDGRYREMSEDVRAECIAKDRLVLVQCYPTTPIGFWSSAHWDLAVAVDEMYRWARAASERGEVWSSK